MVMEADINVARNVDSALPAETAKDTAAVNMSDIPNHLV